MHSFTLLSLAAAVTPAIADTHYFFSGFFSGNTIVGVEFDDEKSSLTLVNNITTDATSGSKWIALDVCIFHYEFEKCSANPFPSLDSRTSMSEQPATSRATPSPKIWA